MNLRELRNSRGLTRKFVAGKLHITADHLSRIERGATPLHQSYFKTLAIIYDVEEKFFLNLESQNANISKE